MDSQKKFIIMLIFLFIGSLMLLEILARLVHKLIVG
ncbi:hypothetical protein C7M51_01533 [Mixta intestinalis]|uniref:Uncharacterized protein n=1 Tax=Mixta intestinalis TaxID=1615494 RepID=A0A6P1PZQ2_9GAMM|nr:hypothetical protein C7M51_01533 [Mixta intestinalis]